MSTSISKPVEIPGYKRTPTEYGQSYTKVEPIMTDPKEVAAKLRGRSGFMRQAGHTDDAEIDDEAATTLETLSSELERVKGERDQALEAEDEAKDCFWAIYPEWLELSGKPGITTEAAQTALEPQSKPRGGRMLTKAQIKFLRACADLDQGDNPRGSRCVDADMRTHAGLLHMGLIALNPYISEYVLTPQGRKALSEHSDA
jgi:hypothetical protein